MRNRWHVGMAGRSGLDLSSLDHIWHIVKVRRRHRKQIVADLLEMEDAALNAMHKKD
jgi:hypothetical protein